MYKFVIVTDSDRASGFRLAGAEVYEVRDIADAKEKIPPLLHKDDIGIFYIDSLAPRLLLNH